MALSRPTPSVSVCSTKSCDVLGDALVGVVGGVAQQLHAVVVGVVQPAARDNAAVIQRRQRICSH